jgi:hypothetical protein
MHTHDMADAAYAVNIPPGFAIAGGYIGGAAFHVWTDADWQRFPGSKLPIWVGRTPGDGPAEGREAAAELARLRVPLGSVVALDMENRVDGEYVTNFGQAVHDAGYRVWVYGSVSSVASNPPLNGYWLADWVGNTPALFGLLGQPHVRAVQFLPTPGYDVSLVRAWTEGDMWI